MRRAVIAGMLCGALTAAHAGSAAPPLVSNERQGYAFEFPRVLAEQRLFGIAHGVSLLATACLDSPDEASAVADAYTHWYEQQQDLIETLKADLATFYFGARATEASRAHVAAALKLRDSLRLAPDSEQLKAACASFPEALRQPRYDLGALFQLEHALAAMLVAARAEAHTAACAARLPEAERADLNARHAEWQNREADVLAARRADMVLHWEKTATPGKPEDWLQAAHNRHTNPTATACAELPGWLESKAASLAQSFAGAPLPTPADAGTPADATAPDNVVSAVTDTRPEAASATPAATAAEPAEEAAPATFPNLFELLMRLFDERPHEDAARPGTQPARSQRAHP